LKSPPDPEKFQVPDFKFQVKDKLLTWNLKSGTWNFASRLNRRALSVAFVTGIRPFVINIAPLVTFLLPARFVGRKLRAYILAPVSREALRETLV
jgi:hypothetical protein